MTNKLSILKGIHPGAVIERELKKRKLSKGRFAISIQEYPQTLGAITNGKRDMNTALSLKIEQALGLEEGYLMTLQVFHDIKKIKEKINENNHPNLSIIRPAIFWDTSIDKIDWQRQKQAIIKRIMERGNEDEKAEIIRFYGNEIVNNVIDKQSSKVTKTMNLHK